jgi:excisionase family DNA binding protein
MNVTPLTPRIKLLKLSEVEKLTNCKKSKLYSMVRANEFPAPKRFGRNAMWPEDQIHEWIATQLGSVTEKLDGQPSEACALDRIRVAIRGFHLALDKHKHGGIAASIALDEIQSALGMHWVQGKELALQEQTV